MSTLEHEENIQADRDAEYDSSLTMHRNSRFARVVDERGGRIVLGARFGRALADVFEQQHAGEEKYIRVGSELYEYIDYPE